MSLFSEYAGFSRVTIHKYFKNKDLVFRAVCNEYQSKCHQACLPIIDAQLDCWEAIALVMDVWSKSVFEEVNDSLIYKDLHYYAQQVAADIFLDAHVNLESVLCKIINNGVGQRQLDLQKMNLSDHQFASILVSSLNGINSNTKPELIRETTEQTLNIFRLASEPVKS